MTQIAKTYKDPSHYMHMKENLVHLYGKQVGTFLANRIAKHMRKKEYVDNFRICEVGNKKQEDIYHARKANGCCGSVDETIEYKDDHFQLVDPDTNTYNFITTKIRTFKFGFNYGH